MQVFMSRNKIIILNEALIFKAFPGEFSWKFPEETMTCPSCRTGCLGAYLVPKVWERERIIIREVLAHVPLFADMFDRS